MPISLVEKSGFQALVYHLTCRNKPQYVIPSRRQISRWLSDRLDICTAGFKGLQNCAAIGITTDVWTRANKESVLSLVAHYIHPADPENNSLTGSLQTRVIGFETLRSKHTADNISCLLTTTLNKMGLQGK
ncbi:hypothetical protein Pmar_PMAR011280, partial [Perkinsus marinus ATCC 50983]